MSSLAPQAEYAALTESHLQLAGSRWIMGADGAVGEFSTRAPRAAVGMRALSDTGGVAISLPLQAEILAYEIVTAGHLGWHQGLAFCLPASLARSAQRELITELGPDRDALRAEDRNARLFDLGCGIETCDYLVRTHDAALIKELRAASGSSIWELPRLMGRLSGASPDRVLLSRFGRIELREPILLATRRTVPVSPSHKLRAFLGLQRGHLCNIPTPPGFSVCLVLQPAHPTERQPDPVFDPGAHRAFQRLLKRYGIREYVEAKREVAKAVRARRGPEQFEAGSRLRRTACLVALKQLLHTDGPSTTLASWLRFRTA